MLYHDNREAYEAALSRACKALRSASHAADVMNRPGELNDCLELWSHTRQLLDESVSGRRHQLRVPGVDTHSP